MKQVWIQGDLRVAYDGSATLTAKSETLEVPACPFTEYFSYFLAPNSKGEEKLLGSARVLGIRRGNQLIQLEELVFIADKLKIHMRAEGFDDFDDDDASESK